MYKYNVTCIYCTYKDTSSLCKFFILNKINGKENRKKLILTQHNIEYLYLKLLSKKTPVTCRVTRINSDYLYFFD